MGGRVQLRLPSTQHRAAAGTISGSFGKYSGHIEGDSLFITPAHTGQRIEEVLHDALGVLVTEDIGDWLAEWDGTRRERAAAGRLLQVTGPTGNGWTDRYVYSADFAHRLWFERRWGEQPLAVVAGANAGTGDTTTTRRATLENAIKVIDCWTGVASWGNLVYRGPVLPRAGGVAFVNLFSARSKDLAAFGLAAVRHGPNHPKADELTGRAVRSAAWVFAAWGGIKAQNRGRRTELEHLLRATDTPVYGATCTGGVRRDTRCRWLTSDLDPRHPLRMSDPHPVLLTHLREDTSTPIWRQN